MENFSPIMGPTQTISRLNTTLRLVAARVSYHEPNLANLHKIAGPAKAYKLATQDAVKIFFVQTIGWPDPTNLEDKT